MMRKLALMAVAILTGCGSEAAPPPAKADRTASAVFATGCFWCTESDFDKVPGVISTTSGYTSGRVANPSYEQVSAGDTGHIESVRVVYDPTKVSYAALVDRALRTSDPLDAGGQFCDRGYQYRPAIFVADAGQRRIAAAALQRASRQLGRKVATLLLPAARFYPAEGYHQDYYKKNPVKYRFYRFGCRRDARVKEVWGKAAG